MAGLRLDSKAGALVKTIVPGESGGQRCDRATAVLRSEKAHAAGRNAAGAGEDRPAPRVDRPGRRVAGSAPPPSGTGPTSSRSRPPLPAVRKNAAWVRNPIDALRAGPAGEGGAAAVARGRPRETLIRRVSLDLTGLPPTPGRGGLPSWPTASPDAYEKVVDRLLASPHYGERWAPALARPGPLRRHATATTPTGRRSIWRIATGSSTPSTRDMPFDQFTIEQLAGDLLPERDRSSRRSPPASTATRMTNEEGGIDQEEYRVEARRRSRQHDGDASGSG